MNFDNARPGAPRTHRTGHSMCSPSPCRAQLPRQLQRDGLRTWRAWRRGPVDADAFRAYHAASDAALATARMTRRAAE
jgi:hypothetical protein